jgi:hypothetical protein
MYHNHDIAIPSLWNILGQVSVPTHTHRKVTMQGHIKRKWSQDHLCVCPLKHLFSALTSFFLIYFLFYRVAGTNYLVSSMPGYLVVIVTAIYPASHNSQILYLPFLHRHNNSEKPFILSFIIPHHLFIQKCLRTCYVLLCDTGQVLNRPVRPMFPWDWQWKRIFYSWSLIWKESLYPVTKGGEVLCLQLWSSLLLEPGMQASFLWFLTSFPWP